MVAGFDAMQQRCNSAQSKENGTEVQHFLHFFGERERACSVP
jgi:hypothetical protein